MVTRGGLRLPAAALRWRFSRSSGPGGQHVNTADTRAELVCDLRLLTGKPREVELVRSRLGEHIRVVSSAERSQLANRQRALARLAERLDAASAVANPRRPTRPPRGATEARLAGKTVEEILQQKLRALPLGRVAEPQDVADAVVFLASRRAGYVSGAVLALDGAAVPMVV